MGKVFDVEMHVRVIQIESSNNVTISLGSSALCDTGSAPVGEIKQILQRDRQSKEYQTVGDGSGQNEGADTLPEGKIALRTIG